MDAHCKSVCGKYLWLTNHVSFRSIRNVLLSDTRKLCGLEIHIVILLFMAPDLQVWSCFVAMLESPHGVDFSMLRERRHD